MSDIFAFDKPAALDEAAAANNIESLSDIEPTKWHGTGLAVGDAFPRAFANIARAGVAAGEYFTDSNLAPYQKATDKRFDAAAQSAQTEAAQAPDVVRDAVDYWTPTAQETGRAAQITGNLIEGGVQLGVTLGNPALLAGTQGIATKEELQRQGVDASTASDVGLTTAAATLIGAKIPVAGKSLATRLATGAAGNLAVGEATRRVSASVLEHADYPRQSQQFATDLASLSIDTLTGLLFGASHHVFSPKLTPSEVDATLAARNAKSFQEATTPGKPADVKSEVAHQDALATALDQLDQGAKVDIAPQIEGANFEPNGHVEESIKLADQVATLQEGDSHNPTPLETPPGSEYAVHEGEMTDEQLRAFQGLRSDVQADQNLGRPGEGVSREQGRANDGGSREVATGEPLRVYRGENRPLSAADFDEAALGHATGHPTSGLGVYFTNDPEDAARYGQLAEHHLDIRNPKTVKFEDLPSFDSIEKYANLRKQLKAQGHDGVILDASHLGGPVQYVAFDHAQVLKAHSPAVEVARTTLHDLINPSEATTPSELPEVAALQRLAEESPDAQVHAGYDAEGNPVNATAAEAARAIQEEHAAALNDTNAYNAAVSCFLRNGA